MDDKYIGKMFDNRYEILERIGSGGMANVYKAKCHKLNRLVAIKILKEELAMDEEFRRRFRTESQAVAMLSHANIMGVYDVGHADGVDYIVMELLDGITLKQYIQRKGALNWKEALHFTIQICKALDHAHSRGIIHRDIKPHNIMILRDGNIKVADFGIARLTTTQSTLTQEALGSVHYISPEQAKGSHIDARSDIYSVGVVLYEMLTNRLPYEGGSPVAVAIQHINSMPLSPREINPDIPEALEAITMKAMAAEKEKRYESAAAMLKDLEEFRKNPNVDLGYKLSDFAITDGENEPTLVLNSKSVAKAADRQRLNEKYARTADNRRRNSSARWVAILAGVFAVVLFLLGITYFLYNYFIKDLLTPTEDIEVPTLLGLDVEYVQHSSRYSDFIVTIGDYDYESNRTDGTILEQEPSAGRHVKPGQVITVTVAASEVPQTIPDILNKESREAVKKLNELGFYDIDTQFEPSDTVTSGYVISVYPGVGESVGVNTTISLVVSSGRDTEMTTVPNLSGQTSYQAQLTLQGFGLKLGSVTEVFSDQPIGFVVYQGVAAGTPVPKDFSIDVQVSKGPEEEEEPPVDEPIDEPVDQPPDGGGTTPPDDGGTTPPDDGDGPIEVTPITPPDDGGDTGGDGGGDDGGDPGTPSDGEG